MSKKGIAVFYHIAGISRWKSIVLEHLEILEISELYDQATKIFFCFIGNDEDFKFLKMLTDSYDKIILTKLSKNVTDYEYPTLLFLQNYIKTHDDDVFYFHIKGASYNVKDEKSYKGTNNWRKYMNFYLLTNWKFSILNLDKYDIVGTSVLNKNEVFAFFCGNYWWATSEYLKKCKKIQDFNWNNRWDAERWLASGNPDPSKIFSWENKYYTLNCFYEMDTNESDWQQTLNARFLNT
jgi:hypothetical protein